MGTPEPSPNPLETLRFYLILVIRMSESEMRSQSNCSEEGLSCQTCTSTTAKELARTCQGLRGKMVAQLFVQLYPEPACARMHSHFAAEYRAASSGGFPSEEVFIKEPASLPLRAMVAFA